MSPLLQTTADREIHITGKYVSVWWYISYEPIHIAGCKEPKFTHLRVGDPHIAIDVETTVMNAYGQLYDGMKPELAEELCSELRQAIEYIKELGG